MLTEHNLQQLVNRTYDFYFQNGSGVLFVIKAYTEKDHNTIKKM